MYTKTIVLTRIGLFNISLISELYIYMHIYIIFYLCCSRHVDGLTLLWVRKEHTGATQVVPTEMVPDAIQAQTLRVCEALDGHVITHVHYVTH